MHRLRFKKFLAEKITSNVSWTNSGSWYFLNEWLPLGKAFDAGAMQQIAYHKCSFFSFQKIVAMQGTKKSLSVATKFKHQYFANKKKVISGGEVASMNKETPLIVELKGMIKAGSNRDVGSMVDPSGRRWVLPELIGPEYRALVHSAITKIAADYKKYTDNGAIISFLGQYKKTQGEDFDLMQAIRKLKYSIDDNKIEATTADFNKMLSKMIKDYVESINAAVDISKEKLQKVLARNLAKKASGRYNEFVMNDFHVQAVYVNPDELKHWQEVFDKHGYEEIPVKSNALLKNE